MAESDMNKTLFTLSHHKTDYSHIKPGLYMFIYSGNGYYYSVANNRTSNSSWDIKCMAGSIKDIMRLTGISDLICYSDDGFETESDANNWMVNHWVKNEYLREYNHA